MTSEELYEAMELADGEIDELTETLRRLQEKEETMKSLKDDEEVEGSRYRMRHIQELSVDNRLVGQKGIKLRVYENGLSETYSEFYFNLREAQKGVSNDKTQLMQRLLDVLSTSSVLGNPQNPKLAPIAKKIFDEYGHEITDVMKLKNEQEIWVSFGEAFISPFTYCLQAFFDSVKGVDLQGERTVTLREQLMSDVIQGKDHYDNWEVFVGLPNTYDVQSISPTNAPEKDRIDTLMKISEIDPQGTFLQMTDDKKVVLYPEVAVSTKLKKGHKELWPSECQVWIISKNGYIYCKPMPQLCLCVSDMRTTCKISSDGAQVEGFVVNLQKKMQNPQQMWKFNPDATISPLAYPDLVLTYNGNRARDLENMQFPDNVKPGNYVFLMACERLPKKLAVTQRFALKQERFDNLGQWKFCDSTNPEWSKLAYSWPVTQDGELNMEYDWPMEGYIIPEVPPIRKDRKGSFSMYMFTSTLSEVSYGDHSWLWVTIVGPDLTNYMKEMKKEKDNKRTKRLKNVEKNGQEISNAIEDDINLHCDDLTIRQLELLW
ncbi:hypothetical protein ScPMuIL_015439 [Solemya velum]